MKNSFKVRTPKPREVRADLLGQGRRAETPAERRARLRKIREAS